MIGGRTEAGCLHGVFAFLRRLQAGQAAGTAELRVTETAASALRIVNHWGNLDGTVERGYAGGSIFFSGGR